MQKMQREQYNPMNRTGDPRLNSTAARITFLREDRGWSAARLARAAGVSRSQITRLESGECENISSDTLIRLSGTLDVSTDYLLCLTNLKSRNGILFEKLGLTEKAVELLVKNQSAGSVISRMAEQESFPALCHEISRYVHPDFAEGCTGRNAILKFGADSLKDYAAAHPKQQDQVMADVLMLEGEQFTPEDICMGRIERKFHTLLEEMKTGTQKQSPLTRSEEALQMIQQSIAGKDRSALTPDDIADGVMAYMDAKCSLQPGVRNATSKFVRFILRALGGRRNNHPNMVFASYQELDEAMEAETKQWNKDESQ